MKKVSNFDYIKCKTPMWQSEINENINRLQCMWQICDKKGENWYSKNFHKGMRQAFKNIHRTQKSHRQKNVQWPAFHKEYSNFLVIKKCKLKVSKDF